MGISERISDTFGLHHLCVILDGQAVHRWTQWWINRYQLSTSVAKHQRTYDSDSLLCCLTWNKKEMKGFYGLTRSLYILVKLFFCDFYPPKHPGGNDPIWGYLSTGWFNHQVWLKACRLCCKSLGARNRCNLSPATWISSSEPGEEKFLSWTFFRCRDYKATA